MLSYLRCLVVASKSNTANKWETSEYIPRSGQILTHPESLHEHLQFILKLFVLLRLNGWGKKLIKPKKPNHIPLPFTPGQVESVNVASGGARWTRNGSRVPNNPAEKAV